MHYELVIIGAGAAGAKAAFTGAENGLKTLLVEMNFAGGTCLNAGCIPTKFLLGSTASIPMLNTQKKLKCLHGDIAAILPAIQERKNRYIKGLRSGLEKKFVDAGIDYVHGQACFVSAHTVRVTPCAGEEYEVVFKKCIVASGSAPAFFPGIEPDGGNVLSSTGLLELSEAPESLIIVGGGVIGIELGEFYHRLGTKITLIEAMNRIALSEDTEISLAVQKVLTREGWSIHVNRRVRSVKSAEGGVQLQFEDGEKLTADKAVIAAGRCPGTKFLDMDKAGLKTVGNGWIETDNHLLAAPDIYAVGDVNGRVLLAHAGEHQATYAARHAAGLESGTYSDEAMPSCIYGHYEMMHVGPHVEELLKTYGEDHKVSVSRSQLIANPIAQSCGTTQGFVKIGWVNGRVYSMAAWGYGVSHLTALAAIIVKQHWTEPEIIFAHPTLDESIKSALLAPKESA